MAFPSLLYCRIKIKIGSVNVKVGNQNKDLNDIHELRGTTFWYCELNCEQMKIHLKDREDTLQVDENIPQQLVANSN